MGKLFKRYVGKSHKKAGGKVRTFIANDKDDRFCIAISGEPDSDYILRLSPSEVERVYADLGKYLDGAKSLKSTP